MKSDPWAQASRARSRDRWAIAAARWNCALTDALIEAANIPLEALVLDVACGSGEPALDILQRFPSSRVIAFDTSAPGLVLASEKCRSAGVSSRVLFAQADVHSLPLRSESIDRTTCRFGVMFFEDIRRALSEVRRVLKARGRVALLAWGPFEQPLFESTMAIVLKSIPGAQLPSFSRMAHRFASPGCLSAELQKAGFQDVSERAMVLPRIWAGSAEELWEFQQEISIQFRPLLGEIPETLKSKIDTEVTARLEHFRSG
ncbi:MAG TPA: methyltransferase domain-containing protein, partial [Terriglobales bacterium]|nr:methyltransferase domain-containing protein [Terriglobales bacterium]